MRILIFPKQESNPFVARFSAGLENAGHQVDDFTYGQALRGRYDVLHLHWPDSHLASRSWYGSLAKHARLAALILLLRLRGTRIVWMIHNLQAHDRNHGLSTRLFSLWFTRACTHIIALTQSGLDAARSRYPALRRKVAAVIPHGHYRDAYVPAPSREQCRAQLQLPQQPFTYLFFGNVRRYKNVPQLIKLFRSLHGDVQLVIAGQPGFEVEAGELEALAAGDERVIMHLKFVEDAAVPLYFGAADAVVLPFDSVLNSGSVLLALSFDRRVLAPHMGALPEIQQHVGAHWLWLYEGPLTAASLQALRTASSSGDASAQRPDLSAFDWNSIADRTLELYRRGGGDLPSSAVRAGAAYETHNEPTRT